MHMPAYSKISRNIQGYSGIIWHIQNSCIQNHDIFKSRYILNPGLFEPCDIQN